MNKRILIISPYFPPTNAADMQRVRMSLPYFETFGWTAEVVTVNNIFADLPLDPLLLKTVPQNTVVHVVNALSKKYTLKLGLGSIGLRALPFYLHKVNNLLKTKKYDLIYFSTTQFPVCILGRYWKNKFKLPYVIDMQDPWHSEYYKDKPKSQRPAKYWFSYRMNKYFERIALKSVDGLIAVSESYLIDLKNRYPGIQNIPDSTITFGAFEQDLEIAELNKASFDPILNDNSSNIVYIGRGGEDMHRSIGIIFQALRNGIKQNNQLKRLHFYFIGTSYNPARNLKKGILHLAEQYGVENQVTEITERISYYHALVTLQLADALFIPGSDDIKYTASKIYPYLSTQKPLLAVFNGSSPAINVLKEYGVKHVYNYEEVPERTLIDFFENVVSGSISSQGYNIDAIKKYSAREMTSRQCALFEKVINEKN